MLRLTSKGNRMSKSPSYKIETWETSKFIEYARNPRKNDHAVDDMAAAIREYGFRVPILAKSDGTVVDGHLRLKAAKKLGLESLTVMLCDDLSDAQIKAFRISVNRVAEFAQWDEELLKVEFEELKELGFDLDLTGFETQDIQALGGDSSRELDAEKYTAKISTPIYEIKGDQPSFGEMYDTTKTGELSTRIMKAQIPDDVRGFLMSAATRHTVFNYEKIAEFYAHADPETQELMEDSALVIIDYQKAVESGYVKLSEQLMQLSAESDQHA